MLYPQQNPHRQTIDLSGIWNFQTDPSDEGTNAGWQAALPQAQPVAVPASWNDQFAELRDFLGPAWYETTFQVPWGWEAKEIWLRFDSINYLAEVWLNGSPIGAHEGGHLPFSFEITHLVKPGDNILVVRVDGRLAPQFVPPGAVPSNPQDTFSNHAYPDANFDFFPFCGIQRPVHLLCQPPIGIEDITVVPGIRGTTGLLEVTIEARGVFSSVELTLSGEGDPVSAVIPAGSKSTTLVVPNARFWSPRDPYLYLLKVGLKALDGSIVDEYQLPVGIRTIAVSGDQILLNSEPILLKGFGRHEDFPVNGRGLNQAVIIKDYALLKWIGANSFRTTHYPYSDTMMDLADKLGFLVIDEIPAVGLFFDDSGLEHRLQMCKQQVTELIHRDKNHPSVIAWSIANEPHSHRPPAKPYFKELYDLAKKLDASRPVTLVSAVGLKEEAFEFLDFVCLNRYYGWYTQHGQLELGLTLLDDELEAMHKAYPKPLVLSEFGADAIPGWHALPAEMFSEEYQADLIAGFIKLLDQKPFVAGQHVWNMCDFKTGQAVHRVGAMNYKGVFTRDRRPKLAAHRLRELWNPEKGA